jgi:hypothetical protein
MSFAFNLGGDDIDLDETDLQISSKDQDTHASLQDISTPPVKTYAIGDNYPQDASTLSLVSSQRINVWTGA